MKLSEAIRKGSEGKKQCRGHLAENYEGGSVSYQGRWVAAVCALGAAFRGGYLSNDLDQRLYDWILGMNDHEKMSMEEIIVEVECAEEAGAIR